MIFDKEVKQNLVFIGVGCAVCSVLAVLGALLIGEFSIPVLLGCIVGGLMSFGNFLFMTIGIIMALETGDEKLAKKKMRSSRIVRTAIMLGIIALTLIFPHYVHWVPVVLSTFYPRILIGVKGYWDFFRHRNAPVPEIEHPAEDDEEDKEDEDGFEKFVGYFSKEKTSGENKK